MGNPYPDTDPDERGGRNLYTNSVIALDAHTGTFKWHFQFTPYDTHVALGWAALAFGGLAAATGAITFRRPVAAAVVMVLTGMLGCVAISVFFINTWYIGAMPLWLCAAVLRVNSAGPDALTSAYGRSGRLGGAQLDSSHACHRPATRLK